MRCRKKHFSHFLYCCPVVSLDTGAGVITVIVSVKFIELVQGFELSVLLAENVSAEEVWQDLEDLVVHVSGCGDSKDVVEFLKGALLCFRNPEINHYQGKDVQATVFVSNKLVFFFFVLHLDMGKRETTYA